MRFPYATLLLQGIGEDEFAQMPAAMQESRKLPSA